MFQDMFVFLLASTISNISLWGDFNQMICQSKVERLRLPRCARKNKLRFFLVFLAALAAYRAGKRQGRG